MRKLLLAASLVLLSLCADLQAAPSAESEASEIVAREGITIVHLWAPWCSNCMAEMKSGGWTKMVKDNPDVRFVFVSIWNAGDPGEAMLKKYDLLEKPNVTVLADPGPRAGTDKLKRFLDLPVSWIPTTWVYKTGDLRYAMNYGEVRFDVLQQFVADSKAEW